MLRIELDGIPIRLIGDTHLGKVFQTGIPLDRRGEREESIWKQFEEELTAPGDEVLFIHMGDLFDKMVVPFNVLMRAANLLSSATRRVLILRGNHDASRDTGQVSAFDVLEAIIGDSSWTSRDIALRNSERVSFITQPTIIPLSNDNNYIGLIPWDPFRSPQLLVADIATQLEVNWQKGLGGRFSAIFGHWDIDKITASYGNMIPTPELQKITNKVYIGHVHTPGFFSPMATGMSGNSLGITVVGSIQPMSHGEDPAGKIYKTMTLSQVDAYLKENGPQSLRDCAVRVLLGKDEELPELDCLQLTAKPKQEDDNLEVKFEQYDLETMFRKVFQEYDIEEGLTQEAWTYYQTLRNAEE